MTSVSVIILKSSSAQMTRFTMFHRFGLGLCNEPAAFSRFLWLAVACCCRNTKDLQDYKTAPWGRRQSSPPKTTNESRCLGFLAGFIFYMRKRSIDHRRKKKAKAWNQTDFWCVFCFSNGFSMDFSWFFRWFLIFLKVFL